MTIAIYWVVSEERRRWYLDYKCRHTTLADILSRYMAQGIGEREKLGEVQMVLENLENE